MVNALDRCSVISQSRWLPLHDLHQALYTLLKRSAPEAMQEMAKHAPRLRAISSNIRVPKAVGLGMITLRSHCHRDGYTSHVLNDAAIAGLAMAFSSVSVVVSSLLLQRYKRPPPVLRDVVVQR